MNYTTKKSSVIFEIPLSDYFGKGRRRQYDPETKSWGDSQEYYIESIQDKEEWTFDNFESFSPYIKFSEIPEDDIKEAKDYLISKGYTPAEIDLYNDTFESDILRAHCDAYDSNYQFEWLQKYYSATQHQIFEDLADNLSVKYQLLDNISDQGFQRNKTDQEFLRLEISKKDIREWLKVNCDDGRQGDESDYIDYFHDYALDFDRQEIDTEYIDQYNSLGSFDGWLDIFSDNNEISAEIEDYRKDETDKINNLKRAGKELEPAIDQINDYIEKYISQEPAKTKITRQTQALKSVIKNAI